MAERNLIIIFSVLTFCNIILHHLSNGGILLFFSKNFDKISLLKLKKNIR